MPALAPMTIAGLAESSGVDVESIRSFEELGFFSKPESRSDGEPRYDERDLATLTFILRARTLGFSLESIGDLLDLAQRKAGGSCSDVYAVAMRQLDDIRRRIAELTNLERLLAPLAMACPRTGSMDDCPILTTLQQPA